MGPVGWTRAPDRTRPPARLCHPLQCDHGDHPAGLLLVLREARCRRRDLYPLLVAIGVDQLLRLDRDLVRAHLDLDPRGGLDVVVPVGVLRRPRGGRDDHHPVAVGKVDQRRHAFGTRPRPDVVQEQHRGALERTADLAPVRPELGDDLLVPVVHAVQFSHAIPLTSTQAPVITATTAANQNRAAHIPPGTPVSRSSASASDSSPKRGILRRRPRCSSRTDRSAPNSRNHAMAAAKAPCSVASPHQATAPTTAPVTSTDTTPYALRTCRSVATSRTTTSHSEAAARSVATSRAPTMPRTPGAG